MTDTNRAHNIVNCYDGCTCDGPAERVVGPRFRARDAAERQRQGHELGDVEMLLQLVSEALQAWHHSDWGGIYNRLKMMQQVADRIRRA